MNSILFACPCLFGVESLLADECRALGFSDVQAYNGRVTFRGGMEDLARANIGLRCAERVLVELGEFPCRSFDELFEGTRALPWEDWIGRQDAFPVRGWSLNSKLHSVPDCQSIIKKAVVRRLGGAYRLSWFEETGPRLQIRFSLLKDRAALCLDTSGEGLHKRGYRAEANAAPLKETLAAALVMLSRFRPDLPFCDPLCGSGTILIEAAMLGEHRAPGLARRFSAESWGAVPAEVWQQARQQALAAVRPEPFVVSGSDLDPDAVALTLSNAQKAGVGAHVRARKADIADFAPKGERGIVVCNPPYGERMMELDEARALYRTIGRAAARLPLWNFYVIAPDDEFEDCFGRKADKKRKLYNGTIQCNLYQYFRHPRRPAGAKES